MAEQKTATNKTATKKTTTRKVPAAKKETDHLDAPLFDSAGARQGEVRLPKLIFAEQVNTPVMHQAFVRQSRMLAGVPPRRRRGPPSPAAAPSPTARRAP